MPPTAAVPCFRAARLDMWGPSIFRAGASSRGLSPCFLKATCMGSFLGLLSGNPRAMATSLGSGNVCQLAKCSMHPNHLRCFPCDVPSPACVLAATDVHLTIHSLWSCVLGSSRLCVTKRRDIRPLDTSRNYSRTPSKARAQASKVAVEIVCTCGSHCA